MLGITMALAVSEEQFSIYSFTPSQLILGHNPNLDNLSNLQIIAYNDSYFPNFYNCVLQKGYIVFLTGKKWSTCQFVVTHDV